MKKKLGFLFIFILLVFSTTSPALTIFSRDEQQKKQVFFDNEPVLLPQSKGWMKTFGGIYQDFGNSVMQTSDGGYIITGFTNFDGSDYFKVLLIRTDADGNKVWNRTFGETDIGAGNFVQQTIDGGYIISGFKFSVSDNTFNVWLIKTDSDGYKVWDRTYKTSDNDFGWSAQQTTDGGYVIIGETWSSGAGKTDAWLIKTDANGDEIWNRTFGGINYDVGRSIQQTSDGGYIIVGCTESFSGGVHDFWLIKANSYGIEEWNRTFGGADYDFGESVQQTIDGGYIITGIAGFSYNTGFGDFWLIKTNSYGIEEWNRTFGGGNVDWGYSVQQTTDTGYIITGSTYSFGAGESDVWLIKTDADGNKLWDKTFGGEGIDSGISVQQTTDEGYIITGGTFSFGVGGDVWLIKTDSQGKSKNISLVSLWLEKLFHCFPCFEKMKL